MGKEGLLDSTVVSYSAEVDVQTDETAIESFSFQ
jgi:hypothetical protein